jgi:hypothetical protein
VAEVSKAQRKRELRAEIAAARTQFSENWVALKEDANIPKRVRESVRERKFVWISAATVIGFILSRLPARKKEVLVDAKSRKKIKTRKKKAGFLMILLKLAFGVLKPTITAYATKKLADVATAAAEAREVEVDSQDSGAKAQVHGLPA